MILLALLNGTLLYVEPTPAVGQYCESVYVCTVTGVWWAASTRSEVRLQSK